jgi:hypothetical protein
MPRTATRKKGQKKDPNAPKRPPTAFFLFARDRRPQLKASHPGAGVAEIAKLLGADWQNLSDDEKKHYYAIGDKEKAKYDIIKAKYAKQKAANSGPKRPPTAFFLYARDRRPMIKQEDPGASVTDVAKILGEEWRNLPSRNRVKYDNAAAQLKAEYDMAKAKFLASHQ